MSKSTGPAKTIRVMSWVFITIGSASVIAGALLRQHDQEFLAHAVKAQGTVVDYSTSESTDTRTGDVSVTYKCEVQYTADTTAYRTRESGASSDIPRLGQSVTVYYV